jgi:hypothetical protein
MRYRLRTLLILLAIGPPMLAGVWWAWIAVADALENFPRWKWPTWYDYQPLFAELTAISALIAIVISAVAIGRRVGST